MWAKEFAAFDSFLAHKLLGILQDADVLSEEENPKPIENENEIHEILLKGKTRFEVYRRDFEESRKKPAKTWMLL
jgi:hypothetical protein